MGNWNSSLVWVLPYLTAALRDNEDAFLRYYDEIEICDAAAAAHFKSAMQIRNRSMVDRSHLVIFCVEQKSGGAYQTMQYAKRVQKPCVNLWEQIHHSEHADWE